MEARDRVFDMPLGTLDSVVRAERATDRRLMESESGFVEGSRGAEVGRNWDLERPLGRLRSESVEGRGCDVESVEERDTRDEVGSEEGDRGERSSGVDGDETGPSMGCVALI